MICPPPIAVDLCPRAYGSTVCTALVAWSRRSMPSWPRRCTPSWPRCSMPSWPRRCMPSWPRCSMPSWPRCCTPSWPRHCMPSWPQVGRTDGSQHRLMPPYGGGIIKLFYIFSYLWYVTCIYVVVIYCTFHFILVFQLSGLVAFVVEKICWESQKYT